MLLPILIGQLLRLKLWARAESFRPVLKVVPQLIILLFVYVVYPSQATAYKIGMIKIIDLKQKAKKALGKKFDIRYFHEAILVNGAVPLTVLEKQIDEMIEGIKNKIKDKI